MDMKCPFSAVQASGACHCSQAQEVIRRGGSEYDCTQSECWSVCRSLVAQLNAITLPALGYVDDLTLTPKSVYLRVLLGGLQGLRQTVNPQDEGLETSDIWSVVDRAKKRLGSFDDLPVTDVLPAIQACKLKRRRRGT